MNTMEHEFIEEGRKCGGCKCKPCKAIGTLLLLGIFVVVLYTAIMLPKIVRNEVQREPALKAGGVENYQRILSEVYSTPEYKKMMSDQLNQALAQNKAIMEMYSKQGSGSTEQSNPSVESNPAEQSTGSLSGVELIQTTSGERK